MGNELRMQRAASNLTVTCVHLSFCWFCGKSIIISVGIVIGNAKSGTEPRADSTGCLQGVCGQRFCGGARRYDCAAGVHQQTNALSLFWGQGSVVPRSVAAKDGRTARMGVGDTRLAEREFAVLVRPCL